MRVPFDMVARPFDTSRMLLNLGAHVINLDVAHPRLWGACRFQWACQIHNNYLITLVPDVDSSIGWVCRCIDGCLVGCSVRWVGGLVGGRMEKADVQTDTLTDRKICNYGQADRKTDG